MIEWLYTTRLLLNKPQTDIFNQPLTILFWITQPPNCVRQTAYCVFYNKERRMCSWSQTQQSLDGINIDRTQCRRICKSPVWQRLLPRLSRIGSTSSTRTRRPRHLIHLKLCHQYYMTLLNNIKASMPLSFVNILSIARLEPFQDHRVIFLLT